VFVKETLIKETLIKDMSPDRRWIFRLTQAKTAGIQLREKRVSSYAGGILKISYEPKASLVPSVAEVRRKIGGSYGGHE
jgi:hypothetical protein